MASKSGHLDRATSDSGVTLAVNIASLSSVRSPKGNRGEHTSLFTRALITFLSLIAIAIFLPFGIILSIMVKDTPLFNTLSRVFTSSRAAGDRGDPQSSKASKEQPRKDALIAQFRQITGAKSVPFSRWLFLAPSSPSLRPTSYSCLIDYSQIDATKYLKKYGYKLEAALDGLYSDPAAVAAIAAGSREANGTVSNSKIGEIFDDFKGGADVIC